MEAWIDWARGPLFRFALIFMVLGLARHLLLTLAGLVGAMRRAGDRSLPTARLIADTLGWLLPLGKIRERVAFSLVSIVFHASIILVPLFLAGHIELWRRGIGLSWPALPAGVADVLTLVAVAATAALLAARLASPLSRALTRPQDALLPLLIALPFLSGFLVSHPEFNPFGFQATLFVHLLSADLIFILIPLTKLSHMVLLPTAQVVAEAGWHFPAASGRDVAAALGKENRPI